MALKQFTAEQQREIVFRDLNTDEQSHVTEMDTAFTPNYQNMIGFFARSIMRDLRLVGGFDVLFGKMKEFVETELFDQTVDLDDLNTLRNLSEIEATRTLVETFKTGDQRADGAATPGRRRCAAQSTSARRGPSW